MPQGKSIVNKTAKYAFEWKKLSIFHLYLVLYQVWGVVSREVEVTLKEHHKEACAGSVKGAVLLFSVTHLLLFMATNQK